MIRSASGFLFLTIIIVSSTCADLARATNTLPDSPAPALLRSAAIEVLKPDWDAARQSAMADGATWPDQGTRQNILSRLNHQASDLFPGIHNSPVPVLLPFDRFADSHGSRVAAGFEPQMFEAGPAGYSAIFTLPVSMNDGMRRRVFSRPVELQITGSRLIYQINDPLKGKGSEVRLPGEGYRDLRRVIREGYVRYHFRAFGVPYVVSIHCLDSVPRSQRLACREASAVAERFLLALRVSGGQPQTHLHGSAGSDIVRPAAVDPAFTYLPPGQLLDGTGYRGQPGHADPTVYAQIRFPLAQAPAYANSQSFLNWGDCFQRGRIPRPRTKDAVYRCKGSDKELRFNEAATENYSYPWQDNFCEARDFGVGQCANGRGHQGQDIRPADCQLRNEGADRCTPGQHAVIAARDGTILRSKGQQGAYLLVNSGQDHFRLRYMHMDPRRLDQDNVLSGRRVSEGEQLGTVSNYQDRPGGTTNHLHLDLQVFTEEGWLWVNPYATLIASYERLLGARGREVMPQPALSPQPPVLDAEPASDPEHAAQAAEGDETVASAPRQQTNN